MSFRKEIANEISKQYLSTLFKVILLLLITGYKSSNIYALNNTFQTPSLTIQQTIIRDNGGTATLDDFDISINDTAVTWKTPTLTSGSSKKVTTSAETYTLSEKALEGYENGEWHCNGESKTAQALVQTGKGSPDKVSITPPLRQTVICANSSNNQPAKLTLIKTVMNSHKGNAAISDFDITTSAGLLNFTITSHASSYTPSGIIATTTTYTSDTLTVDANTAFTLKEEDLVEYYEGNWICSNGDGGSYNNASVTLNEGESVTCTIVNNDQVATLSLKKTIINDDSLANDTDWILTATGPATISGVETSTTITSASIPTGIYTLSVNGPFDFELADWKCSAGSLLGNKLTLAPGDSAICNATIEAKEHINPIPTLSNWLLITLSISLLFIGKYTSTKQRVY